MQCINMTTKKSALKAKLPTIKSLEAKLWLECKRIIRANYPHVCISCNKGVEGKQLHTGHYFRKKFIPLQMKYDLRLLRNQCSFCNRRLHGNLEWYTINLLKQEGEQYLLDIADDIIFYKQEKLDVKQQRVFLQDRIQKYKLL